MSIPRFHSQLNNLCIFKKCVRLIFLLGTLLFICSSSTLITSAQGLQNAQFTQGNQSTNTMNFKVPLGSLPGRGVNIPLSLNYNSKVWRLGFMQTIYWTANGKNSVAEAIYSEYATAGWTTTLNIPIVEWPRTSDIYWYTGKPYASGSHYPYTFRVARVFIHMPDGSIHELRKADAVQQDYGTVDQYGTFYAVDGSRMRYDANGATDGTLYLVDGTRYNISSSTVQYVDRNGNTLTYDVGTRQWTDTMNRTIGMPWPASPQATDYQYSVPGFGGNSQTYIFKFRQLSSTLSPNSPALKKVADYYLPNPSATPGSYNTANYPVAQTDTLFHSAYTDYEDPPDQRTLTQVIGRLQAGGAVFDPVVLAEIVLPNNLSYKFFYNNYGELDKIIYPSGAYERHQYGTVPSLGYLVVPYEQGSRGLWSRWLSANGSGTDEAQWTYGYEFPQQDNFVIVATAPGPTGAANGVVTKTYLHNFPDPQNNFGYTDSRNGLACEERIYAPAAAGGALLRRSVTYWGQSLGGPYNRPSPGTGTYSAWRNPRAERTATFLLDTGGDALSTTTTSTYDTTYWWNVGLDRTNVTEYGYINVDQYTAQNISWSNLATLQTGQLFRSTTTAYLTGDNNYRSRNILGLPTSNTISDSTGVVAQDTITYDESSYPLIGVGPVAGWNDPQSTYRGNPTTISKWLNYPTPTWFQTHTQYDQFGNVRKVWDGMGRQSPSSEFDYSSSYFYAYATTTSTIAPDPSGVHGQATALASSRVFDLNTGLVTSSTDANGVTTSFEYNDPLYRLTKVIQPDGGWTSTTYNDDPANTYVRTQTLQHTVPTQQVAESYQYLDKLGRAVRSFVNEGSTYLTSDTQYDRMGRVSQVSNPYKTTSPSLDSGINPSNLWTINTYDGQYPDRVLSVTTADGAHLDTEYGYSLTTGYLGTTIRGKDPMGRGQKSIADAFGRMLRVIEDPTGAAYQTNYSYDGLSNLRKIEQGGQVRYFGYDSLSRLIFVRHVEQTINSSLPAWTDPVTNYSGGWTAAFTYDNNGNLLTRRDARNITTTFTYDQVNRVTTVRYTNDPQNTPGVDNYYDGYRANTFTDIPRVKGHLWQTETSGQVKFTIDNFDVMSRPTIQRQQFWSNNAWSSSYQVSVNYDLAGATTGQTYPSGHTVTYDYDPAGRLKSFSGNLGDGVTRTYANNFQYNELGALQQEQFGTDTPLFHKQRFNSRGQLWDVRLSTISFTTDPANGDRGSIVNYFSTGYTQGGSGTDNNGNLLRQEIYVPGGPYFQQTYGYDNLNRVTSVSEKLNGAGSDSFKQVYAYDRWGNRSVDYNTSSANVPRPLYTVDTNTNRLVAPTGANYGYDNAGNQTNDTYTGGGQRTFDAENHMLSATEASGVQSYKYSGSGLRVRRIVNGAEIWQVYGIAGGLLAEYQAGGASSTPSKEYGYRNGQLLVTASSAPRVNVAASANGGTATASETHSAPYAASGAINGDRKLYLNNNAWSNSTATFPQWLQVDFNGSKMIDEVDVFSVQNLYNSPSEPTQTMTFNAYGLTAFQVQYWNGSSWVTAPGGSVTGNNNVWKQFTFTPITTNKIRIWITGSSDGYSRMTEVEAWGTSVPVPRQNVAASANGGTATASETHSAPYAASGAINGDRKLYLNNNAWSNSTATFPQWLQVDFNGSKTIDEVDVFSVQNLYNSPSEPTQTMTFNAYGLTAFQVQYWNGSSWVTAPGGSVTGNNNVWKQFTFTPITTDKIRIWITGSSDGYSRMTEVEAWGVAGSSGGNSETSVQWLVTDQLGTPRMTVDQTGTLTSVKRHDYLPFGEEIGSAQVGLIGGRDSTPGYAADTVRQKFTGYEFDAETGLNYAQARYQSSVQGRFTSVDPLGRSATITNPQSFNRYTYVMNNPTGLTDPSGLIWVDHGMNFNGAEPSSDDQPPGDPFERGSDIIAAAEAAFDQRIQNTRDALAAQAAYDRGDYDTGDAIMASNPTLEYQQSFSVSVSASITGLVNFFTSNSGSGAPVTVVIWEGASGPGDGISSAMGHVSYIIDGVSYSWEKFTDPETGKEGWKKVDPASEYLFERGRTSQGRGYVLDFGSAEANTRFGELIKNAYNNTGGYSLTSNNCGHAFQRAINAMKLPGVPENNKIKPAAHEKFIKNNLKQYISDVRHYPQDVIIYIRVPRN